MKRKRKNRQYKGRLNMAERGSYGVITTLISTDGKRVVREFFGLPNQAMIELCEWIDARPKEGWRVESLSTPMTILTDLRGHRTNNPEHTMLGQVGRHDLLARKSR